eukprot:5567911-Amphidinium_carterae.1
MGKRTGNPLVCWTPLLIPDIDAFAGLGPFGREDVRGSIHNLMTANSSAAHATDGEKRSASPKEGRKEGFSVEETDHHKSFRSHGHVTTGTMRQSTYTLFKDSMLSPHTQVLQNSDSDTDTHTRVCLVKEKDESLPLNSVKVVAVILFVNGLLTRLRATPRFCYSCKNRPASSEDYAIVHI